MKTLTQMVTVIGLSLVVIAPANATTTDSAVPAGVTLADEDTTFSNKSKRKKTGFIGGMDIPLGKIRGR